MGFRALDLVVATSMGQGNNRRMACLGLSIFWFGKVACLVALIVVYSLTTLWGGGTENAFSGVGQVLVIGGAVSNLVHFAILKRA